MLAIECSAVFGHDGDTCVQFVRVFRGEDIVRTYLHPVQQGLDIGSLDPRLLQLSGSYLVVQKRRSNQVFQIVIGLFLRNRPTLGTECAATSDVESPL